MFYCQEIIIRNNWVNNVRRVQNFGFGRVQKSDVVGNGGNYERWEGGGIIKAMHGGSGVADAHITVCYSAEILPTWVVIVSEEAANASTCLTQDLNYTYSTYWWRKILKMSNEVCNLGYNYDVNIGPFYNYVEE